MTKLSNTNCEACRADAPVLSEKEINDLLPQLSSWNINDDEGIKRLVCSYAFLSYEDSVAFTNKVANLAEQEDHHPEITFGYSNLTIKFFTYAIDGLSENDFICAAKIDKAMKY